jgi:hypothetical protein
MTMFKLAIFKKVLLGLVTASLLAGLFLAAFPAGVVAAASDTPATQDQSGANAKAGTRLEKLYQTELKTLDRQKKWIDVTQKIIGRVNQLIEKFLGKGKNVEPLREALGQFKAGVLDAKAKHDSAAAIFALHKGFGDDGKVTDRTLALETVKTAGKDLKQAATTYRRAVVEMHKSIRQFIRENRSPKEDTTPAPQNP